MEDVIKAEEYFYGKLCFPQFVFLPKIIISVLWKRKTYSFIN